MDITTVYMRLKESKYGTVDVKMYSSGQLKSRLLSETQCISPAFIKQTNIQLKNMLSNVQRLLLTDRQVKN